MESVKIGTYLSELGHEGVEHPLFNEIKAAYLAEYSIEDQDTLVEKFIEQYKRTIHLLGKYIKKSKNSFLPDELEKVEQSEFNTIEARTLHLKIVLAVCNYAKRTWNIDSPNNSMIVKISRDKPMLTPLSFIMLIVGDEIEQIILNELNSPTRDLNEQEKLGRLILILYFYTNINNYNDIQLILNNLDCIYYFGGVCFFHYDNNQDDIRFLLIDVVVLALMQYKAVKRKSILRQHIKIGLNAFVNKLSDGKFKNLSLIKLRQVRNSLSIIKESCFEQTMYFVPTVSQALPQPVFIRLITGRAYEYGQVDNKSRINGLDFYNRWQNVSLSNKKYIDAKITQKKLRSLIEQVSLLSENKQPRKNISAAVAQFFDNQPHDSSPYLMILVAWFYSLLTQGGMVKKRIKDKTAIDYVKSTSSPFFTLFSTCDIKLLDADSWIKKLNEMADLFKSATRKRYVYYLAVFLKESEIVPDLCLSDLDVYSSPNVVDANLISPAHGELILKHLEKQFGASLIYQYAYILFCLCFYSGLRRGEAQYLTLGDFSFAYNEELTATEFDFVTLSIRNNRYRVLKTPSAKRKLPLDGLWPKEALAKLRTVYSLKKLQGQKDKELLFSCQKSVMTAFSLITELMRTLTGDRTLRIHHLRHSFANWTWCCFSKKMLMVGQSKLMLFNDDFFAEDRLKRLQERLKYNDYSRKKAYILSHLMGHKDVTSTLNSYLHLKDIFHFLNYDVTLTKYFLSECVGRATLAEDGFGMSIAERIKYSTQAAEQIYSIKPAKVKLKSATLDKFSCKILGKVKSNLPSKNTKDKDTVSIIDWARAIEALEHKSIIEVSQAYRIPLKELEKVALNAKLVSEQYPHRGKKLPKWPSFPVLVQTKDNKGLSQADITTLKLCELAEEKIKQGGLTWPDIRSAMEILRFAAAGKNYAVRCPERRQAKLFIRFCQILGLKGRHFVFRYHQMDLSDEKANMVTKLWKEYLASVGFGSSRFVCAPMSEGQYLQKGTENGVLEIAVVATKYKRIQRHYSIFSFFHLMLILSFNHTK